MIVQDYLRHPQHTLETLHETYGIRHNVHEDGRVILNYSQIDSYDVRFEPIVRECRGLVLDSNNNWALVARAFSRFFNLGEEPEE